MANLRNVAQRTRFLNVDLDIRSTSELQPLLDALGSKIFVLYSGRLPQTRTYEAHLELSGPVQGADRTIRALCALIGSLPNTVRHLWDNALIRDLNIGLQAELKPSRHEVAIAGATLKAVARINARIVFTVYAPGA